MSALLHDIHQRLLVARLPALPEILVKLIRLCRADDVGMAELSALIAQDAAMAAKVVRAASSSLYPGRGHKPGVRQALQTIGLDATKNLLICESIFQVFNGASGAGVVDLRGFWRHALTAAVSAQRIAVGISYRYVEEAYLAGLLHDIGRLALRSAVPMAYAPLAELADDADLCLAEQRALQITHAEAGSMLIKRWGFDSYLADSVLYHHETVDRATGTHPLIRLVILADAMATYGIGQPTPDIAQALCALGSDEVAAIFADTQEQVRQAAQLLNLDLSASEPPAVPPGPVAAANDNAQRQLAAEVQQVALISEAQRFLAGRPDAAGVLSAIRQSAALLFGFKAVLVLLSDDRTRSLHAAGGDSAANSHAEFMMSQDGGGAVSVSMSQGRVAFIESDTRLPKLSDERQLTLQVSKGRVKPNAKSEPVKKVEVGGKTSEAAPSLAEEQLLRLLNAEYLVCLPLRHEGHCHGVLLGATLALQVGELQLREDFLLSFAAQAAAAIGAAQRRQDDEQQSEARVAEAYRLAARRVVHEASSPLAIVKNYLAVLDHKVARQEPVSSEVTILGEEIDRVGQIIRGLTETKPAPRDEPMEIDRIVGAAVNTFCTLRPAMAVSQIKTRLQSGAARLAGHGDALKQILFNLINNAVEAQPAGGEILVATNHGINRDGRLYCSLTVEDHGPGIAPDVLAKLFSPLATSKGGDHMGLGLSIVHDLVRQLDGTITCRSSRDGTCFEVLLPICDPNPRSHQ